MKPIIEVNHLSKKYRYGESQPYYTLRDILVDVAKKPLKIFHTNQEGASLRKNEFWALKDISFSVNQGEAIGIIGSNGAGKSTLLKILSRITPPSSGEAILRGRVGSLLEVGTGFHQELTGRENIYLNGAILGMTRREINRKFDEIVDFSGVDKFLDTPVKHYSSGMYVRLAFSVAAHLEPDILVVDEVLAVGDAEFQKKCLGKMDEVSRKEGRTVLFVSHNMQAIRNLCARVIYLSNGSIAKFSNTVDAINAYQEASSLNKPLVYKPKKDSSLTAQIRSICFKDKDGKLVGEISPQEEITVEIEYEVRKKLLKSLLSILVYKEGAMYFLSTDADNQNSYLHDYEKGLYKTRLKIAPDTFSTGIYQFDISLQKPFIEYITRVENIGLVVSGDDSPLNPLWKNKIHVLFRPSIEYMTNKTR
jgi:lipopolysaccharide transport system ATP-binding protein